MTHAARYLRFSYCIDAWHRPQVFGGMGIGVRRRRDDVDVREVAP